ncbi:MAG: demethoxyubiquinone hydroxylase family protein [Magnetovibrio sp.]|nr:demethoxyubiquinone hydroxylase family protein [Magnetovibrio sp.]
MSANTSPTKTTTPIGGRMPGDPTKEELIKNIIRVDQAGEYGAVRIYEGQLAVLGKGPKGDMIRHMKEQEDVHLDTFSKMVSDRRVRPTALMPLWHVAGFALGAGTALLGEKAAMACTVAVEETIDEHYQAQIKKLGDDESDLRETCIKFREEELEHRDLGLKNGAEQAPAYALLSRAIKFGTSMAIRLSEKV